MKKIIIWLFWVIVSACMFYHANTNASSILDDVMGPACDKWYITCDQSLIQWLVDSSVKVSFFSKWKIVDVSKQAPFIVRLTVFLMRLTALLAVTSMIVAWLSYIWAQWDDKAEKWVLDWVKRIVIWLLLMSTATTIITLIISIFSNSSVWWLF